MSIFVIDPNTCNKDGICALECPTGAIEINPADQFPRPVENAAELCISCGHCVAVCPEGSVSLANMSPDQCPPLQKEWMLSPEAAEHFLRSRRSIRVYKEKPVEKKLIERLIKIARHAPSGHNLQPVNWHVIHSRSDVADLCGHVADWMRFMIKEHPAIADMMHLDIIVRQWEEGNDRICRGAPHLILTHAVKEDPTAQAACTIALTYLELAAGPLGLGTCWAGFFNAAATLWPPLQKALGLPEGHISFGAMMLGRPKFKYKRLPNRNEPSITWR